MHFTAATPPNSAKELENTLFKRPGQPAELASIYVQLADPMASYATGQIYGSSGGAGQP